MEIVNKEDDADGGNGNGQQQIENKKVEEETTKGNIKIG